MNLENKNNLINNENINEKPSFVETKIGDATKFTCYLGTKEIGSISVKLIDKNTYNIGGLFVDPTERGKGISSLLVKQVNAFLERNNSIGKLLNTIKGDAAIVYEKNNWVKGNFNSKGAYGAYEYTYDGRKG